MTRIYMGDELEDVQIVANDSANGDTVITIVQDGAGGAIFLTPEGARSLAFTIIGMTDEMRRKETAYTNLSELKEEYEKGNVQALVDFFNPDMKKGHRNE